MTAIVRDARSGRWRRFSDPRNVVVAYDTASVVEALDRVERACAADRMYAAGFVSYEAAPAFDAALVTQAPEGFPLVWFGLYDSPTDMSLEELPGLADPSAEEWRPSVEFERYSTAFDEIQELIRRGDTYQINLTYRLRGAVRADPLALFTRLADSGSPPFGAYVEAGRWAVCSASPELFFHRAPADGQPGQFTIECRPMKGTAPRGLWFEQDLEHARRLRESEKDRAENVMIVDMVRNDLGRIATPGTVRVSGLFDVERYPSVLQLTSTVTASSGARFSEVMSALFPAASITGTPKARAMEIIADLECSPRRVYTGAIGFVEPDGRAQFSVAIRTVLVERDSREGEYGIGGGIVADSVLADEWNESRIKARVLTTRPVSFDLLETLLWTPEGGYQLLGAHLKRLLQSVDYFGFAADVIDIRDQLERLSATFGGSPHRVRMLVSKRGAVQLQARPHDLSEGFGHVALAASPVDSADPFLYHKTTRREVYERALAGRPECADVVLFNQRDELTESTIANLVVQMGQSLYTPPIACGLLPGTLRAYLLAQGKIREKVITRDELPGADACYLINSVRGFHPVAIDYRSVGGESVS